MFIVISNIFFMFVVRTQLYSNEANATNKSETKILGRLTVASTAVCSLLRNDWVRRDRPSLFHKQNLFIMRTQKDNEVLSSLLTLSDAVQMILMDENTTIEYKSEVRSAFMVVSERITNERTFPVEQGVNLTGRTAVC